jgi:hypothetical protein
MRDIAQGSAGDELIILPPRLSRLTIVQFVHDLIGQVFSLGQPQHAHGDRDVSQAINALVGLRPSSTHHPETQTPSPRVVLYLARDPDESV